MNIYLPFTARLPSAYQEVEYIQSSGTQYFVVGNTFKTSYKIVLDFQMVTIGGDYVPLGVNSPSPYKKYGINAYGGYFKVVSGGNAWSNSKSEDTNRHTLTIDKNTVTVDGTDYSINYVDYTYSYGVGVFAYKEYDAVRNHSSNKLYKLDIYDENGTHIYDLVPCYRKSDSVIGMYDLVNNQFYTNSGTGTFSKGSDATMSEIKNIYIGEYAKPREPDSNTIVYWKLDGDAKDSSGNHRDGTVSGNLTYESIGNINVAKFTGGQSIFRSGSEFTLNNNSSFTFSVWAKVTSWSSYNYSFGIQKTGDGGTWDKEIAILRDGSVRGYYYTSAANWCTTNSGNVQLNQWYHLAYTYDGSVQKVYINGTLVTTNTPSSGSYTLASPCLTLSRTYTSWYSPYKGYLSNFILQNNAWTADYISNYYDTYKGLYGLS